MGERERKLREASRFSEFSRMDDKEAAKELFDKASGIFNKLADKGDDKVDGELRKLSGHAVKLIKDNAKNYRARCQVLKRQAPRKIKGLEAAYYTRIAQLDTLRKED